MAEFIPDNSHIDASNGKVTVDGKTYNSKADMKWHKANGTEPDATFHTNANAPQPSIQMVKASNIANSR